jgi:hypothetical protein
MAARKKRRKKRKTRNPGVSSVQSKRTASKKHTDRPSAETPQAVISLSTDEINRLISKGKAKTAVTRAKLNYKSLGTDESKMILVNAYAGRIREMISKGFLVEAKTLLELIRERYNCPDLLLDELHGLLAIHEGRVAELVRPLDDPNISPERRTTIERIIKNELVDLNLLAQSNTIAADHPLKTGAEAVIAAFAKVSAGSVPDAEIAVPAIPRRSPLAPWKMLIRALAYFYRHDDEKCEKYLLAVDPESAPGRIVPLISEMITGKLNGNHGPKSLALVNKVTESPKKARDALRLLDNALAANKSRKLFKAIRKTVKICERTYPEIMDKLKQHIAIRSWMAGLEAEDVNRALGGPSLKNAYFWRLHARAAEIKGKFLWACAMLEEFRKHALHEGWFSKTSAEASVIYLYMADMLKRLPADDFKWLQSEFEYEFEGFEPYYHNQPRSILEAVRKDTASPSDTYFLYPEILYRLAAEISPTAEIYRLWLEWVENHTSHWKKCDAVALAWHADFPDDTRPLLYLMKSAEQRNALKKALGYLDAAEGIDGLNPDVKRARLRLLAATAVRHLKQKKTHLAQNDISAIEGLPQSREGDRPAFVVALRFVCAMIDKDKSEWLRCYRDLTELLEYSLAAKIILQGLSADCGLADPQNHLPVSADDHLADKDLVTAVAKGCRLGDDMGIAVTIPQEYEKKIKKVFTVEDNLHDSATIRIIAETALQNNNLELAYTAAGAGLSRQKGAAAKFLLLRARSLPAWEGDRQDDCIAAAIELARRERDMDLIDEAIELRRNGNGFQFGFSIFGSMINERNTSMEADELNQVLQFEKEAREYPSFRLNKSFYGFGGDDNDSQCRHCDKKNCPDREAPYLPDALYDEDFDDDDDDDDDDFDDILDFNSVLEDLLPDLPPELMAVIMKVFKKHGKNGLFPDPEELARKDPWLGDQLLREMQKAEAAGSLPDYDRDWFPGWR